MNKVEFPQFELVGPSCKETNCQGVLVDHLDLKTKSLFKRCSICSKETRLHETQSP